MHLHGCLNTFPKPGVIIFMEKSEYTHDKMGIQHTMLPRGVYTPYTIQTGVYTVFSIYREGIYMIQFTFPTPSRELLVRSSGLSSSPSGTISLYPDLPPLPPERIWEDLGSEPTENQFFGKNLDFQP